MKLLFIILIVIIFFLLLLKTKEHLSIIPQIKDDHYKKKLLFIVKLNNNYYNLYNFNKTEYGKYKNYQDFIKSLILIFDDKKFQNYDNLSMFINNLYKYTDKILNETLIKVNNESNKCKKDQIYSYTILDINGYYYLDGFHQFLKELYKIYKKEGINKLLSKNYFILLRDIIFTKKICNINVKTGIPDKKISQ